MNPGQFIYTLPQWIVFAGITAYIYGTAESKHTFRITGLILFIVLGIYSIWALQSEYFSSHRFLTPEEIINNELEEVLPADIPFPAKIFPAYLLFLISGVMSIAALIFELKDYKRKMALAIVAAMPALLGFFIITGSLRSL